MQHQHIFSCFITIIFIQQCSLDKVCDVLEWIKCIGVLAEVVLFTGANSTNNTSEPLTQKNYNCISSKCSKILCRWGAAKHIVLATLPAALGSIPGIPEILSEEISPKMLKLINDARWRKVGCGLKNVVDQNQLVLASGKACNTKKIVWICMKTP